MIRHTAIRWIAIPMLWMSAVGLVQRALADPTPEQQYMLEWVNRFRTQPASELERLVNFSSPGVWASPMSDHPAVQAALAFYQVNASVLASQWSSLVPAPPLAWNDSLASSAEVYSNLMVSSDQQQHGLGGMSLGQRFVAAGYSSDWGDAGQVLFGTAQDTQHAHSSFAIDWGPDGGSGTGLQPGVTHRVALMDPLFKEYGVGFQTVSIPLSNSSVTGPLVVTGHLANQLRSDGIRLVSDAILTGSIIDDSVLLDGFYTPGEGVAGMAVFVYHNSTGQLVASGQTNSAGGFNISLAGLSDSTLYRIEAPGSGQSAQTFTLNTWQENYGSVSQPEWVTFYDNVYASFVVVPEPAGICLLLITVWVGLCNRRVSARFP